MQGQSSERQCLGAPSVAGRGPGADGRTSRGGSVAVAVAGCRKVYAHVDFDGQGAMSVQDEVSLFVLHTAFF